MVIIRFILTLFVCLACTPRTDKGQARKNMLIGTWYAEKKGLYHTLYVQDTAHIGLDTHIDTTLFYEYRLLGDSLALYKPHGELINYNKILQLTPDTLVFESLLDRAEVLGYSKKSIHVQRIKK